LNQSFALLAEHAGLFVTRLEVGRWIQAGSVVGHVYDAFSGEIRAEVRTPVSGLVSSVRRQPLLIEGDLMIRILMTAQAGDRMELMLHGQGQ